MGLSPAGTSFPWEMAWPKAARARLSVPRRGRERHQLGWLRERWDCLTYLAPGRCSIVKGIPGGGKSRLVQRSLRDAVFLDQRVRYVEVCGSKTDANFIDLLGAIIDGDSAQLGSEIHK